MDTVLTALTAAIFAGVIAERTKTIVHMSTLLTGTSALRSSQVMSATKACMRWLLYCGLALTMSTAEGAKSQAYTRLCLLSSRSGNAVLPTPQPTCKVGMGTLLLS